MSILKKRYERKYITDVLLAEEVELALKLHPSLFFEKYPPRFINNIYFDNPSFKDYQDSVQGISQRKKIRIRWYGDLKGNIKNAQVELKYKNGVLVSKERFPLIPFKLSDIEKPSKWHSILEKSQVPSAIDMEIRELNQIVSNRYYRKYFLTPDDKFRITIDSNMESRMVGWFNKNSRSSPSNKVVIELKYDLTADINVGKILRFLPFTLSKNSKYLGAMESW